jgi:hypothetical protein
LHAGLPQETDFTSSRGKNQLIVDEIVALKLQLVKLESI